MTTLNPIRIGDSFFRSYTVNQADGTTPFDLSGITIVWNLKAGERIWSFGVGSGVTVTLLTALIMVELTPVQSAVFTANEKASSWVDFVYPDGRVVSKYQRDERIYTKSRVSK